MFSFLGVNTQVKVPSTHRRVFTRDDFKFPVSVFERAIKKLYLPTKTTAYLLDKLPEPKRPREDIPQEVRERLKKYYLEDIKLLEKLTGEELSRWND